MNEIDDPLAVYVGWTEDQFKDEFDMFKKIMYDGAGIEELVAGITCLNHLLASQNISDNLLTFVGYTIDEACLRIKLMHEKECYDAEREHEKTMATLQSLSRFTRTLLATIMSPRDLDPWLAAEMRAAKRRNESSYS